MATKKGSDEEEVIVKGKSPKLRKFYICVDCGADDAKETCLGCGDPLCRNCSGKLGLCKFCFNRGR